MAATGSERSWRWVAFAASAGAAAIHLAATASHLEEYRPAGVFMAVGGFAQLAWAIWIARGAQPVVALAGALANLGVVWLWVVSRTVGLPFGEEPWVAEHVHMQDVLATALEVVVIVAGLALWKAHARPRRALQVGAGVGAMLAVLFVGHEQSHERLVAVAALALANVLRAVALELSDRYVVRHTRRHHVHAPAPRRIPARLDPDLGARISAG